MLLAAALVIQLVYVLRGRSSRVRKKRVAMIEEASFELDQLPVVDVLVQHWMPIVGGRSILSETLSANRMVICLSETDAATVDRLRKACQDVVNRCNKVANLIDLGLLRPKELVRSRSDLHAELLSLLALIEPFVWFDSIVLERGRWGYRPLQLRVIMSKLRPVSPNPSVYEAIEVHIGSKKYVAEFAVGRIRRIAMLILYKIQSPTIDVRSKVTMGKRALQVRGELRALGVVSADDGSRGRSVRW